MASRGVNKVILVGNVGSDPASKKMDSGSNLASFSVATNETWTDKDKNTQTRTEWHRITAWGKLADICSQYLKKGSKVYIEGRLQTRSWDQDGQKKYSTEIVASEMQMLDTRNSNSSAPPEDEEEVKDELPF